MASQFKSAAYANLFLIFAPFVGLPLVAIVIVLTNFSDRTSPFFYVGMLAMLTGWALLVRSKWDQVKKGDLFTWGVTKDHPKMRRFYRMSYIVMIAGWLVACFSGLFPHV